MSAAADGRILLKCVYYTTVQQEKKVAEKKPQADKGWRKPAGAEKREKSISH